MTNSANPPSLDLEPSGLAPVQRQKAAQALSLWLIGAAFLVPAAVIALIRFRVSPLYPANNDANPDIFVYLEVGNSWREGLWPYRDVFDVKGPIHLLLFRLFADIGPWSVIPALAFLTLVVYASLWLAFALARTQLAGRWASAICAIASVLVCYLSVMTVRSSFTVEEVAVPGVLLLLWLTVRALREPKDVSWWLWVSNGLALGVVFWSKYQSVFPWVGVLCCLITLALMKRYFWRALARQVCWTFLGWSAVTLVVLVASARVLREMLSAYFLVRGQAGDKGPLGELLTEVGSLVLLPASNLATAGWLVAALAVFCWVWWKSDRNLGFTMTLSLVLTLWASVAFVRHTYNFFVPLAFVCLAIPLVVAVLQSKSGRLANGGLVVVSVLAVLSTVAPLVEGVASYNLLGRADLSCQQQPSGQPIEGQSMYEVFAAAANNQPIISVATLGSSGTSFVSQQPIRHNFQFVHNSWASAKDASNVQLEYLKAGTFDYAWIRTNQADPEDLETAIAKSHYVTDKELKTSEGKAADKAFRQTLIVDYEPIVSCGKDVLLKRT